MNLLSEFEILSALGSGSYSKVYKVLWKRDNLVYAMKKIKIFSMNTKDRENAINEVRLLASLNNYHIISYKEVIFDQPS